MRFVQVILAFALAASRCPAADAVFTPPRQYPAARYEAVWNKNPFTLRSVPPPAEAVSFARDFVIGAYYGDAADPTVVLVNTKTQERIRLKKNQVASNGMQLGSIKLNGGRKDICAEVRLGPETAQIHYDVDYLRRAAATESAMAAAAKSPQSHLTSTTPVNGQAPGRQSAVPVPSLSTPEPAPSNPVIPIPGTIAPPVKPASSPDPVVQASPSTRRILIPAARAAGR